VPRPSIFRRHPVPAGVGWLAAGRPCLGLEVNSPHLTADANASSSRLNYHVGRALVLSRAPPRRSTTRTGRVGAFLTAEGRFHVRERFSIFRSRAETWVFERPNSYVLKTPGSKTRRGEPGHTGRLSRYCRVCRGLSITPILEYVSVISMPMHFDIALRIVPSRLSSQPQEAPTKPGA
jgi:hypothetical protein